MDRPVRDVALEDKGRTPHPPSCGCEGPKGREPQSGKPHDPSATNESKTEQGDNTATGGKGKATGGNGGNALHG